MVPRICVSNLKLIDKGVREISWNIQTHTQSFERPVSQKVELRYATFNNYAASLDMM